MLPVILLVAGLVTLFVRPRRMPLWAGPTLAAVVLLASGGLRWRGVSHTFGQLHDPVLFLVSAVPLAVLLDRVGFFGAVASFVDDKPHLHAKLWFLAAAVVIVCNLDAAVVLLTPLCIRIARRNGLDPLVLAFPPALLASLASGLLPVSNLTNLLAVSALHLGVTDFVVHLGLPTVVAVAVGWWRYRAVLVLDDRPAQTSAEVGWALQQDESRRDGTSDLPADRSGAAQLEAIEGGGRPTDGPTTATALWRGGPVVLFLLVGFTAGEQFGIQPWVVAALAVVALTVLCRELPWRSVAYEPILLTVALGLLVAGATPHLGLHRLVDGGGTTGDLQALGFGTVGSLASNNLPAALAGFGAIAHRHQVWPLLVGLNMAPVLVMTASLSSLLWRDTARRMDVVVTPGRFTQVGVQVGLPAFAAAALVVLALGH